MDSCGSFKYLPSVHCTYSAIPSRSKYLSDPTEDVRVATENLMADFLREIHDIAASARRSEEKARVHRENKPDSSTKDERLPDITVVLPERGAFITDNDGKSSMHDAESTHQSQSGHDDRDNGGDSPRLNTELL